MLVLFPSSVNAVDKSKFRKCNDMSFCRRNRQLAPHVAPFSLLPTLHFTDSSIVGEILNTQDNVLLSFELKFYPRGVMRMTVLEKNSFRQRPELPEVLLSDLTPVAYELLSHDRNGARIRIPDSSASVSISLSEFRIDVFQDGELVMQLNPRGLFNFEHYRHKDASLLASPAPLPPEPASPAAPAEPENAQWSESGERVGPTATAEKPALVEQPLSEPISPTPSAAAPATPPKPAYPADTTDMWEERFQSHHDHKPFGPTSIGLDVTFNGATHVFGLPEHSTKFSLPATKSVAPFASPVWPLSRLLARRALSQRDRHLIRALSPLQP